MSFEFKRLRYSINHALVVQSVSVGFLVQLAESCSEVINRKSHNSSESSGQQQGKGINKTVFSEPGE